MIQTLSARTTLRAASPTVPQVELPATFEHHPFWQALKSQVPAGHAPRPLILGAPLRRELVDGEQVFLLTPRPIAKNTLNLNLHKLGGAGRVSVSVCTVDPNGAASPVWWLELSRGERSTGKVFSKQLEEVAGQLLSVQLTVRGGNLIYKLHTG